MADTLQMRHRPVCFNLPVMNSPGFYYSTDWPQAYSVPLLSIQAITILAICAFVHFLLKPFHQPLIVVQIICGIILGPSFLSRDEVFKDFMFPHSGQYIYETFSKLGGIFYLFISGVKMDPTLMWKSGKTAFIVAMGSIVIPLATVGPIYFILQKYMADVFFEPYFSVVFLSTLSLTSSIVVHSILSELKLLSTKLGRLAMSTAMINDIFVLLSMIFMKSAVEAAQITLKSVSAFLASFLGMVLPLIFLVRPTMLWIVRSTPEGRPVKPGYTLGILLFALVTGFVSDVIMGNVFAGPLLLGLVTPEGPPLGLALVKRSETVIEGFLMPIFITSCGLKVDIFTVYHSQYNTSVYFIFFLSCFFKMVGTLIACIYCKLSLADSFTVGLIMTFKGHLEMIRFTSWYDTKRLDGEYLATLVLSVMIITAISAPAVKCILRSGRYSLSSKGMTLQSNFTSERGVRVLSCLQSKDCVPSIINFFEASYAKRDRPVCLFILNLVELLGRASPLLIAHKKQKSDGYSSSLDRIICTFRRLEQEAGGGMTIQAFTCIAPFNTVHEDVCQFAFDNGVSFTVIPFHKQKIQGVEAVDQCFHLMNRKILDQSSCTVGILVNQSGNDLQLHTEHRVCILFIGGPDDRDALAYGFRFIAHPYVALTIVRFLAQDSTAEDEKQRQLDDELVDDFRMKSFQGECVRYMEIVVNDGAELIGEVRGMEEAFDIVLVGLRHKTNEKLLEGMLDWSENPELGVIGDFVYSSDVFGGEATVLIVKHQG